MPPMFIFNYSVFGFIYYFSFIFIFQKVLLNPTRPARVCSLIFDVVVVVFFVLEANFCACNVYLQIDLQSADVTARHRALIFNNTNQMFDFLLCLCVLFFTSTIHYFCKGRLYSDRINKTNNPTKN